MTKLLHSPFLNMTDEEYTAKYGNPQGHVRFGKENINPDSSFSNNSLYERVGNGLKTNNKCGSFKGFKGCLRTELHNIMTLDGEKFNGKVFISKYFHSCDKPSCPICFKHGWAVREASNIEQRLLEFSKKYGQIEHIIDGICPDDYGLTYEEMTKKTIKILKEVGVLGGCIIFHAERYHNQFEAEKTGIFGWFYNPHYHILGFIDGGYGKCRDCRKHREECLTCDGFEGRVRRAYYKHGAEHGGQIVKTKGKRVSVHGTAWYQLHHASIVKGKKKFQPVRWFGVCAKNRLKLKKEDRKKDACPICAHDLIDLEYVGKGDPLAEWWVKEFYDDLLDEHGNVKWIEKPKVGKYG